MLRLLLTATLFLSPPSTPHSPSLLPSLQDEVRCHTAELFLWRVQLLQPVKLVACGAEHTLVALASGGVVAWGSNGRGQVRRERCLLSHPLCLSLSLSPSPSLSLPLSPSLTSSLSHSLIHPPSHGQVGIEPWHGADVVSDPALLEELASVVVVSLSGGVSAQ